MLGPQRIVLYPPLYVVAVEWEGGGGRRRPRLWLTAFPCSSSATIMRATMGCVDQLSLAAQAGSTMSEVYDALTALSSNAWRVNENVRLPRVCRVSAHEPKKSKKHNVSSHLFPRPC